MGKVIYFLLLREEYEEFRNEYKQIENVLNNSEKSFAEKGKVKNKLERYVNEVWHPTMNSLNQNQGIVKKNLKKSLGKFDLAGSKLDTTVKYDEKGLSSESEGKTNINLTGLGVEIVSLIARIGKDSYLMKTNKPLLESIRSIINTSNIEENLSSALTIKGFVNTKFQEIDNVLLQLEKEK